MKTKMIGPTARDRNYTRTSVGHTTPDSTGQRNWRSQLPGNMLLLAQYLHFNKHHISQTWLQTKNTDFSWFFVNFETQRVFMRMKIHCYWSLGSISWYFFSKMWHVIFVRAIPHESFQSDGSSWCGVLTSRLVAFRVRKQRSWSVVKVCLHILFPCPYLCPSPSRLHCW